MAMFPKSDWDGITDAWGEHNMCAGGGRKYPRFMATRYGEVKNFPDFVRKAQLMNYETHRAIYEGRIGRMFEPMEGALLWMSIPAQPSLIWQSFTYDLDTHGTYFGIKKACGVRHVFFNESAEGGIVQADAVDFQSVLCFKQGHGAAPLFSEFGQYWQISKPNIPARTFKVSA